jgi:hypothetical protein
MIVLYGKPGCATCESAKKKLALLGLSFQFVDVASLDGWREDGRIAFTVEKTLREDDGTGAPELPLLQIDGSWFNYPEAMARIKQCRPQN